MAPLELIREFRAEMRDLDYRFALVFLVCGVAMWLDYYVDDYDTLEWLQLHVLPESLASVGDQHLKNGLTTLSCLTFYLLLPCLVIKLVYRESLADYGLVPQHPWRELGLGLGMYAIMLPVLLLVSWIRSFQDYYPRYPGSQDEVTLLVSYELLYALYFVGWEFFFRGFLLFGAGKRIGIYSIFLWAPLFAALHFGKPGIEALAALPCAVLLGFVAWKTKSIWAGVVAHAAIAVTLDMMVLVMHGAR